MTNVYKPKNKQYNPYISLSFNTPTNDSIEIVSMANKALKNIYRNDCSYKKAGVIVHNTTPQAEIQMSFLTILTEKKKMMYSIDKINTLMGKDKIHLASQGFKKMENNTEQLSPCYTTSFSRYFKNKNLINEKYISNNYINSILYVFAHVYKFNKRKSIEF